MMYGKTFKTMLAITGVISVAFAAPQTDGDELNNEVAGGFIKKGESVSASWGGFHAAATLNDDGTAVASAGGNGLGASSGYGTGGAGAGAGVFGTGAVSGVGSTSGSATPVKPIGGKPQNAGGSQLYHQGAGNGFFDRIFAIPINVLQSVNTYLNQKQQLQGQPGAAHGHPTATNNNGHGSASAAGASATAGIASYANGAGKAPGADAAGDYGHDSAAAASATAGNGKPGSPMMVQTKTNYDDIFNIPITALRSVQNLLNG